MAVTVMGRNISVTVLGVCFAICPTQVGKVGMGSATEVSRRRICGYSVNSIVINECRTAELGNEVT